MKYKVHLFETAQHSNRYEIVESTNGWYVDDSGALIFQNKPEGLSSNFPRVRAFGPRAWEQVEEHNAR